MALGLLQQHLPLGTIHAVLYLNINVQTHTIQQHLSLGTIHAGLYLNINVQT